MHVSFFCPVNGRLLGEGLATGVVEVNSRLQQFLDAPE
jgi:hypothetical protein